MVGQLFKRKKAGEKAGAEGHSEQVMTTVLEASPVVAEDEIILDEAFSEDEATPTKLEKLLAQPASPAKMRALQILREAPPETILELLVPGLTDKLLNRLTELEARRLEVEARLRELHDREEENQRYALGQGSRKVEVQV